MNFHYFCKFRGIKPNIDKLTKSTQLYPSLESKKSWLLLEGTCGHLSEKALVGYLIITLVWKIIHTTLHMLDNWGILNMRRVKPVKKTMFSFVLNLNADDCMLISKTLRNDSKCHTSSLSIKKCKGLPCIVQSKTKVRHTVGLPPRAVYQRK